MILENNFYQIIHADTTNSRGTFLIRLLPECEIYRGHFPGHPVCPGVCHIGMIREIASHLTKIPLAIKRIRKCRFTAVASPDICPELEIYIEVQPCDTGYQVTACIRDREKSYMEFKGNMAEKKDEV